MTVPQNGSLTPQDSGLRAAHRNTGNREEVYMSWSPRILLALIMLLAVSPAFAEGACPPGQYPIGGQGVVGCAPIPGGEGGTSPAPRPTGRWIKTWGVISISPASGDMGASVGHKERSAATAEALARCANYGAKDCKVMTAYKNQCVAYATDNEKLRARVDTGASKEVAASRVMEACAKEGLSNCKVVYTDFSDPIFKPY